MGLDLMKTDHYAKDGIGSIDDKRMCASVDLMNTYMNMPKKVDCKDAYTKDFYTKIEMPK
jgi:NitT/TauT family transport system substrate-binding protein